MVALEIVLMTRVYALYNRPRWMRLFFTALVVIENVIVMVGLFVHYPWPGRYFLAIYVATKLPPSFSYFGFCTIVIQVVILYFTLLKYLTGNWKTVPIVKLMFRDGTLSFTILTIFSLSMSVLTVKDNPYAVPGYSIHFIRYMSSHHQLAAIRASGKPRWFDWYPIYDIPCRRLPIDIDEGPVSRELVLLPSDVHLS
ncbi:hypothetical protein H1R20_g5628, partial [Candolleomyces eurysporus]